MANFSLACMATELARVVSAAETVIDRAVKVPIAKATRIQVANGSATFIATDTEKTVRASIAAEGEGVIHLDTEMLATKVRMLRGDKPVEISGTAEAVAITQGRTRWKLPVIANTGLDFEAAAADLDGVSFDIDAVALVAALRAAKSAFSTSPDLYYLSGAHVEVVKGELRVVSTDKHLMHVRHLPGKFPAFDPIIIPPEAIDPIAKLIAEHGTVRMTVNEKGIALAADDLSFRSRLIEGTFPDWRRVQPKVSSSVVFDGAEFIAAMERAGSISEDHNNKNGAFIGTKMMLRETEIEIATANRFGEEGNDFCACEREGGDDFEIPVSASLLLKALRSFGEVDTLRLSHTGKLDSAFRVSREASEGEDFRLVMPLRG